MQVLGFVFFTIVLFLPCFSDSWGSASLPGKRRLPSPPARCKVTQGVKKQSKAPGKFGRKVPRGQRAAAPSSPSPQSGMRWPKRQRSSSMGFSREVQVLQRENKPLQLQRVFQGRARGRSHVPRLGYLPRGTAQHPGPAAASGMARAPGGAWRCARSLSPHPAGFGLLSPGRLMRARDSL